MQRRVSLITAIAFAWMATVAFGLPPQKPTIKWHSDIKKARSLTRQHKRPMLLFVTSDACFYCVKMKHFTYSDKDVIADVAANFVPVKIDAAKQSELVRSLGVKLYPTTVIVSPEDKVLDRISGYMDSRNLRIRMSAVTRTAKRDTDEVKELR